MTALELRDKLQEYNKTELEQLRVTIWVEGERYEVSDIDESFTEVSFLELTAKID